MMHLLRLAAAAVLCLFAGIDMASAQDPASFRFGLIGDLAYAEEREPQLAHVLEELDRADLQFVVHVGDLGSPRAGSCSQELWGRRLAQFRASAHPLVYTPGDNEWTDCHEKQGVLNGAPLERLTKLREQLFDGEASFGRRALPLLRQSAAADVAPKFAKYRENARWSLGGVTFLSLHVTGSNNGLGRTAEGDAEFSERNAANLAWLEAGFAHARNSGARAVMIFQQANIFPQLPPVAGAANPSPDGFAELRAALAERTIAFGRPVVLVHGDSHYFRVDKPFLTRNAGANGPLVPNFTRVETFGDPHHHWVEVSVEADSPDVFAFRQRIVKKNVPPAR
jgi:hypothetical protein